MSAIIKKLLNPNASADNFVKISAADSGCNNTDRTVCDYQATFPAGITAVDSVTIQDEDGNNLVLTFANTATTIREVITELVAILEEPENGGGGGAVVSGGIAYEVDYPAAGNITLSLESDVVFVEIDDNGTPRTFAAACNVTQAVTAYWTLAVGSSGVPLVMDDGGGDTDTQTLTGPYPTGSAALLTTELQTALDAIATTTTPNVVNDNLTVTEDVEAGIYEITVVFDKHYRLTLDGNDYEVLETNKAYDDGDVNDPPTIFHWF